MLLKVGAVSRSVVVVGSIPPTSRHSSTAEFPCFHAHIPNLSCPSYPAHKPKFRALGVPRLGSGIVGSGKGRVLGGFAVEFDVVEEDKDDLSVGGEIYRSTLRMNYFGCFFGLPIVISSMRWGISAGRKTMVATAVLLLVLSGPLKALIYLLMHDILGFSMDTLCRLGASWLISISIYTLCNFLRAGLGALCHAMVYGPDILLPNLRKHTGLGVNPVPLMGVIYAIFGFVFLLNSVFLVFLLHLLYSILILRLGMKASLKLPAWLEKAL